MCLQVLVCHGNVLQITDFKNAFCQSHRLNRPLGPILVQPCKGLSLKVLGELIQLLRPVHGLDGAPIEWPETITTEFCVGSPSSSFSVGALLVCETR